MLRNAPEMKFIVNYVHVLLLGAIDFTTISNVIYKCAEGGRISVNEDAAAFILL